MPAKGSTTVSKAFEMLDLLGEHPEGISAAHAAELTGHPFSTAYRLLGGLVEVGYADYRPTTKLYVLGTRVFRLGQKVAHARGYDGAARDGLVALTKETGESSILAVREPEAALTVLKIDGPQFRTTTDPGDRSPLHTSAIGQVLLAFDPGAEAVIDTLDLTPRTPNSLTTRTALRARMKVIREQGWVGQAEENDVGMNALAVPVVDLDGRLLAALALAAPIFRRSYDEFVELVPVLQSAATDLAALLPRR